jgi:glycosyltransferase involved in cell wall biosynthesis
MHVSVLIPTHNRRDLLGRTLDSLTAVRVPAGVAVEVVVVANNCTDGTEAFVAERATAMPLPTRAVNEPAPGLNNARNRGVAEAAGDWLAFLDDDLWVSAGWLEGLVAVADKHSADFLGGHVELWWEAVQRPSWLTPDMEWMLSNNEGGAEPYRLAEVGGLVGANFAVRRAVVETIGPFRPDLDRVGGRLLGGGESEFVQRAVRAGFVGYYAPGMSVKHWVAPHRLTAAYLTGVSRGYGAARVMMKPHWGPTTALRAVLGHLYLTARHGLAGLAGGPAVIRHKCLAAAGRGGLAAACQRTAGHNGGAR